MTDRMDIVDIHNHSVETRGFQADLKGFSVRTYAIILQSVGS